MSESKISKPFRATLKLKTSFLGIFKTVYAEFKNSTLFLRKHNPQGPFEKIIEITQTTVITIDQSNKARFAIKQESQDPIILQTESEVEATEWISILKSSVFPVDTLSPDRFTVISVIGRGFYGKVMLVRDLVTMDLVAVKTVHKDKLIKARKVQTVLTERNILFDTHNPFIVGLKFAFQTETKFYLGMEFVSGGELFRLMTERNTLPLEDVRIYIAELALGLEYLHSKQIIYRDLKPENVLIDSDGHLKITDFGLAHIGLDCTTFCGTTEYIAPEVVKREKYSIMVDWWSLGILTFEMLVGTSPFCCENKSEMFKKIIGEEPEYPQGMPEDAIDFISRLLVKNPERRMGFEELKEHPFLRKLNFDDVLERKITPSYVPNRKDKQSVMNFDSEFTEEAPMDSVVNTPDGSNVNFSGFSYAGDPSILTLGNEENEGKENPV